MSQGWMGQGWVRLVPRCLAITDHLGMRLVRDEPVMGQGRARDGWARDGSVTSLVPRCSAITEHLGTRLVRNEPGTSQGWTGQGWVRLVPKVLSNY